MSASWEEPVEDVSSVVLSEDKVTCSVEPETAVYRSLSRNSLVFS